MPVWMSGWVTASAMTAVGHAYLNYQPVALIIAAKTFSFIYLPRPLCLFTDANQKIKGLMGYEDIPCPQFTPLLLTRDWDVAMVRY